MALLKTAAAFAKASRHWVNQPRDEKGRWSKGFVTGAYSPIQKPKKGDVAPKVSHEPGNPFAPGGMWHGVSGWQSGKPVGQPAGSAAFADAHGDVSASGNQHVENQPGADAPDEQKPTQDGPGLFDGEKHEPYPDATPDKTFDDGIPDPANEPDDAPEAAPETPVDTVPPTPITGRTKWAWTTNEATTGLPNYGSMTVTSKIKSAWPSSSTFSRPIGSVRMKIDHSTGTASIAISAHPDYDSYYASMVARTIKEIATKFPGVKKFEFDPGQDGWRQTSESTAFKKDVLDKMVKDGVPNSFLGGKVIGREVTESDIARDEFFSRAVPPEHRKIITDTVRDNLGLSEYMPKKLGFLTDKAMVGYSGSNKAALAWVGGFGGGEAGGSVMRVVYDKKAYKRMLDAPVESGWTHAIYNKMPPEKRIQCVITHEMGHVLENGIKGAKRRFDSGTVEEREKLLPMITAYNEMQYAYRDAVRTPFKGEGGMPALTAHRMEHYPSSYGKSEWAEYFAESFAAYRMGQPCPAAATKFFQHINIKAFEKLFRQLMKAKAASFYAIDEVPDGTPHQDCQIVQADPGNKSSLYDQFSDRHTKKATA